MPSTYSSRLRIELIATGEQAGTWGETTNTNLGALLEEAISGYQAITHPNTTNYSLTALNGSSDESRPMMIRVNGTLTATRDVTCPSASKMWIVWNATSGGRDIDFGPSGGNKVTVPNGTKKIVWTDGTNAYEGVDSMSSLVTDTADINGGTIDGVVIGGSSAAAGSFTTLTASGNATFTGTLDLSGGALTLGANEIQSSEIASLDATKLTGTVATARLSGTYNISISGNAATASDSGQLDGLDSSAFLRSNVSDSYTSGTLTFGAGTSLDIAAATLVTATNQIQPASINDGAGSTLDADLLDGQQGSFYQNASNLNAGTVPSARLTGTYAISISGDAATLDGIDSTQFLRSDTADVKTAGNLTFNDSIKANLGTGDDFQMYCNGTNAFFDMLSSGVASLFIRDNVTTRFTFARSTGDFTATGAITAGGDVTAFSDAKLKENVETIYNALDTINAMRGVTFTRKDTGERGVGVIAQEMEHVLPEVVKDNDGTLSVAYGNLTGVLIEAVKELTAEVERLKKKVGE